MIGIDSDVISALRDSAGLAQASSSLREIIRSLIEGNTRSTHASATRFHRRPLEAHLLRAAALVFGTSNCASLEHLFNERVQFDLSVIEEAAKATGNDLLNALLLARRQLLIGDHHQLPPFESEKLEKLLASPPQVAQLLSNLPDAVATLFENEIELQEMQRLFETVTKIRADGIHSQLKSPNVFIIVAEGKHSQDIVPTLVFDDGRFTYLRFPGNRDVPAVFHVLGDGSETLVNARMADDLLVVDRVSRRLMLRAGSAVVGVWNDAFDLDGRPPKGGTTVPGVQRILQAKVAAAAKPDAPVAASAEVDHE